MVLLQIDSYQRRNLREHCRDLWGTAVIQLSCKANKISTFQLHVSLVLSLVDWFKHGHHSAVDFIFPLGDFHCILRSIYRQSSTRTIAFR